MKEKTGKFLTKKQKKEWVDLVGEKLWNKLSEKEKEFLVMTAGSLYLGKNVNLKRIFKEMKG